MEMKLQFIRMVEQMHWANARLIGKLDGMGSVPEKAMSLLSHIVASEKVWLTRLTGEDSSALPIWPMYDLRQCDRLARENFDGFQRFLERIGDGDWRKEIAYRNQSGNRYETALADILTHVAIHGGYHRGQIALLLRQAGEDPVNTDFITFARL